MGGWVVFFFNDTATTEIYTLSLHDALPICSVRDTHQTVGQLAFPFLYDRAVAKAVPRDVPQPVDGVEV